MSRYELSELEKAMRLEQEGDGASLQEEE